MTEKVNENADKSVPITKTKAKKSILLFFDKAKKSKILKDIKKLYPDSLSQDLGTNSSITQLIIEFDSYEKAKEAKENFKTVFKNDQVRLESALYQKKKEIRKIEKNTREEEKNFKELNGQLGDRSRGLFEIRKPRLILRNLSFKFNDDTLKTEMEKYGKVVEINLPKKEDGKLNGYGFVTFETMNEARKAMEELNARTEKLNGTKVAVDWCLPKNLFLKNTSEKTKENGDKNENDDDDDEEEEDDENEDDDEEENESDEEKENAKVKKNSKKTDLKRKSSKPEEKFEIKKKSGTKDVQEKVTVFIRNLSFDSNEDLVKEAFSKFGPVKFAKLCYDKDLERPRGTAFIQFETKEGALNACAESGIFEMDERLLQIDMAVSRNQANELSDEKKSSKTEVKDNRNLALAKEGLIYPNSYEARDVSKADMIRREKLEKGNAEKLKLLHYFVSPTRLSVHNLPISCTDEELRKIFLDAIGSNESKFKYGSGLIECRIMRDMSRVNSQGVYRSKGYGFVEFKTFELAKKALHATNNNPKLFKNGQKLIVQFSIEDMRALNKKKQRIEKSKVNLNRKNGSRFDRKKSLANEKKTLDDDSINIDKVKEKNLLKVHRLERKLDKRKNEEENRLVKKQKKQILNETKKIQKEGEMENKKAELTEKQRQMKQNKRVRARQNKKAHQAMQKSKNNRVDNVDRLVDKLYQSKK